MIQITFNPDGTAEHLGDEHCAAAKLLPAARRTARASHIEPYRWPLRWAFHAVRGLEGLLARQDVLWAKAGLLTALTRLWPCLWRVRVVGGPVLPGCYRDRDEAIAAEIRWLEQNRL